MDRFSSREVNLNQLNRMEAIRRAASLMEQRFFELEENSLEGHDPRCLAIARTKLEEVVMWANKAISHTP